MVPASSLKVPRASSYSGSRSLHSPFAYTTLTSYGRSFQYRSARLADTYSGPKPHGARTMVWALPRSLAATCGIILIFSSSGYLDRLPVAFRSLSRLSSALSAKASTLRPFLLNLRSAILTYGLVLKMSPTAWRFMPGRLFHTSSARRLVLRMLSHAIACYCHNISGN